MSGIACIFHSDRRPADPALVDRMTGAMDYRGPDGIAHWFAGYVALGHCQMHTTAESLEERQPLASQDRQRILVMDGYLANYAELRASLLQRGARLRDRSDAELVLHAYEAWGEDCPRHIDGEYAFVIWDAARQTLFCARDHQGLRPLFYHWDGTTFIAASDFAAVLAALPQAPPLNRGYLAEITGCRWYSLDETLYSGILRVPAAGGVAVEGGRVRPFRYWRLPTEVVNHGKSDADWIAEYRAMLADCVREASRSHRPVAFDISGGLDSSSLAALAAGLSQDGKLPAPGIRGYSLASPPGSRADEIAYARAVARHIGMTLDEVPLFLPGLAWFESQAARDRDMPIYPNGAMAIDLDRAKANYGCRVSIGGNGGDQWLDGTGHAAAEAIAGLRMGDLQAALQDDLARLGRRQAVHRLLRFGIKDALPGPLQAAMCGFRAAWNMPDSSAEYWLSESARAELYRRGALYRQRLPAAAMPRAKLAMQESAYLALALDLLARQNAQCGIEARSPMLSRRFVEFSATSPDRLKQRGGINKYIHRRAMAGILPGNVLERRSKAEFNSTVTPDAEGLKDHCLNVLQANCCDILDPGGAQRLLEEYCNAAIDERSNWGLWGIYIVIVLSGLHRVQLRG